MEILWFGKIFKAFIYLVLIIYHVHFKIVLIVILNHLYIYIDIYKIYAFSQI